MPTNDLVEFLESIGVEEVVDHGEEIGARCFMHEERTGSRENTPNHWFINRLTKKHHCFACGYKGHLRSLVVDVMAGDVGRAALALQDFTMEEIFEGLGEEAEEVVYSTIPQVRLTQFPWPPEEQLRGRDLSHAAARNFGVRWDPEHKGWVIPIYSPEPPYDLWGWQLKMRSLMRNRPLGVRKGRTLFGINRLEPGRKTVLVESPLDVLRLYDLDYQAVASFGADVTETQMRLLLRLVPCLVIALDNDPAGIVATQHILETYGTRFIEPVRLFNYPDGTTEKDPGEMTDEAIEYGVEHSYLMMDWKHGVQRKITRLPGGGRRSNDRTPGASRAVSAGSRKNRNFDRRR